jgi:rod shape determining protein RodA
MAARRINVDLTLVIVAAILSLYGIAMVYSAGQTDVPTVAKYAYRAQLTWLVIGLFGAFAVSRASVRLIEWMTVPIYGFTIVLLLALLVPGIGSGAGTAASTAGWLTIAGKRLGQPAEFAKLSVVLMLARVLAEHRVAPRSIMELWKPMVVAVVPLLLIVKQGDLGTAIVFVGIFFAMLFWSGVQWQLLLLLASPVISLMLGFDPKIWGAWFVLLVGLVLWYKPFFGEAVFVVGANVAAGIAGPLIWEHMKPYRQNRLLVFLDPSIDPRGSGYHVMQSLTCHRLRRMVWSRIPGGTPKSVSHFFPSNTPISFSPLSAKSLGSSASPSRFCYSQSCFFAASAFPSGRTTPLAAWSLSAFLPAGSPHVLENVGMTLNLMPITGIPLPFFSYGGSFMLASWVAIGVLARISSEGRGLQAGPVRV